MESLPPLTANKTLSAVDSSCFSLIKLFNLLMVAIHQKYAIHFLSANFITKIGLLFANIYNMLICRLKFSL